MTSNKIRILVVCRGDAGDIFILTGVLDSLKKKYPNALIYVGCDPKFNNILEDNPNIINVLEFHPSMHDYRAYSKWAFCKNNPFDIVYMPTICTQVTPSNWLNGKYTYYLGDFYANQCNVEYGEQFMPLGDVSRFDLPSEYITVHSTSQQGPKNYDYIQNVIDSIKDIPIVQIGGPDDKILDKTINLCGQTTFQEVAGILKGAKHHVGMDSVLMHFAAYVETPSTIIFGGTLPEAGVNPRQKDLINAIEPNDRGTCITSCHLLDCPMSQKCINNILPEDILSSVSASIGEKYIEAPEPLRLSAYMIIKDGIRYGFPFEKAIRAAAEICDEVVVVDGGSTDDTLEKIKKLEIEYQTGSHIEKDKTVIDSKIKVYQHRWDMSNPTLMGDEKQYARILCSGDWLLQLDADEIISEPHPGEIKKLIKRNRSIDVIDFPVINFYGDEKHIRVCDNPWKWRVSKNDPNIIHGIHAAARIFDPETNKMTMDKSISDCCEYIYADTLGIVDHRLIVPGALLQLHEKAKNGQHLQKYAEVIAQTPGLVPCVFHYSWHNLDNKKSRGEFWDSTWHGKNSWTHNSSKDIEERIEQNKEVVIEVGDIFGEIKK